MPEQLSITLHEIDKCGFYTGPRRAEPEYGQCAEILTDLNTWVAGKTRDETNIMQIAENESLLPTYIYDIHEENGDFLLCTWNETPSTAGAVATLNVTSPVGAADVVEGVQIGEGNKPGFATYFWFMPRENKLATLRFQHRTTGQDNLMRYVETFLAQFSKFVVFDVNAPEEHKILGYAQNAGDPATEMSPRFRIGSIKKDGDIAFLRDNVNRIRKIARRRALDITFRDNRDFWQKMLTGFGLADQPERQGVIDVEYFAEYTPSLDELNAIYQEWENEDAVEGSWEDYGFVVQGNSSPVWLGRGRAQGKITINPIRENLEIVRLSSLYNELRNHRATILDYAS